MTKLPVVNTSPLIFLAKADEIELLQVISKAIIVPQEVFDEIHSKPSDKKTIAIFNHYSWLKVTNIGSIHPLIQAWDLGPGESSVLSWAYQHSGTEAIIDDLAARKCAKSFGIPVRGTLGIVLKARQKNMIPKAKPIIDKLVTHGMFLSPKIISQALKLVGE